jgi:hypothetical protein
MEMPDLAVADGAEAESTAAAEDADPASLAADAAAAAAAAGAAGNLALLLEGGTRRRPESIPDMELLITASSFDYCT